MKSRGNLIEFPAFASAHSHCFQRGLRGLCQRTNSSDVDSFWSWRNEMYQLATKMTPEFLYDIARFAYAELAMAGVAAVGEFHYLHHQPDGSPYEDRNQLAHSLIAAAKDVGIRISLLRVLYQRSGAKSAPLIEQRRFCDSSAQQALADVDDLLTAYDRDPLVRIGVACHSVRAVSLPWIHEASAFAKEHNLPFHMHLSEQPREIEECMQEHGRRPVELVASEGLMDENFVAVHATHLNEREVEMLGDSGAFVCVCRTTERDLGDGLCLSGPMHRAGAKLCTGVDGYALSDPFEELRAIEFDERSRTIKRNQVANADELLRMGTHNGYEAIGFRSTDENQGAGSGTDRIGVARSQLLFAGVPESHFSDALVFSAAPSDVTELWVEGKQIISDGQHPKMDEYRRGYEDALRAIRA